MVDLDAVRARWVELRPSEGEALATPPDRVEYWEEHSLDYWPEPHWQERYGRTPRRRLDEPAERMTRVGRDGRGRAVIGEWINQGHTAHRNLIAWPAEDRAEIFDARGELWVIDYLDGRPLTKVGCDGMPRLDGRPAVEVSRYDYDSAGRLVFVLRVFESGQDRSWGGPERGPYWGWTATRLTHDDAGLALVEHVVAEPGPGVADGEGIEAALGEAAAAYER